MSTYDIDVTIVGSAFRISKPRLTVSVRTAPPAEVEHATVIWTFKGLPAGLEPVITFKPSSEEVIVSGPSLSTGTLSTVTYEIKFPPTELSRGSTSGSASYDVKARAQFETRVTPPTPASDKLVIDRSQDPVGGNPPHHHPHRPRRPRSTAYDHSGA